MSEGNPGWVDRLKSAIGWSKPDEFDVDASDSEVSGVTEDLRAGVELVGVEEVKDGDDAVLELVLAADELSQPGVSPSSALRRVPDFDGHTADEAISRMEALREFHEKGVGLGRDIARQELEVELTRVRVAHARQLIPMQVSEEYQDQVKALRMQWVLTLAVRAALLGGMGVSAYLSYLFSRAGIESMEANVRQFTEMDDFPIYMGAGLAGSMLALSVLRSLNVIKYSPLTFSKDEEGNWGVKAQPIAVLALPALVIAQVANSASNVGGGFATVFHDLVVQGAWDPNETKARAFIEDAKAVSSANYVAGAGTIVDFRQAGQDLYMEATGQWTSEEGAELKSGYGPRSKQEMEDFRARYTAAAQQFVQAGNCDALDDLQAVGFGFIDQMEAKRVADPSFAPNTSSFDRMPFDLSIDIDRCAENAPETDGKLVELEDILLNVRTRINEGQVENSYALNLDVRRMQPLITMIAAESDIDPVTLDPVDSTAQEGTRFVLKNIKNFVKLLLGDTPDEKVRPMVLFLAMCMLMLDQIGVAAGFFSAKAGERYRQAKKELAESTRRLAGVSDTSS